MELLNLGCGSRHHSSWTNVDFTSSAENVIAHNLLQGIPFEENFFDVVYHSHVLEHFSKDDGKNFLKECYRVLKPNGIIRIAVPDLERIAKEYLKNMELAMQGNENAIHDYEWIKLELYDQVVRNESGGDMAKYISQENIPNEEYVFERIGEEARGLRKSYLKNKPIINNSENISPVNKTGTKYPAGSIYSKMKFRFKKILFNDEIKRLKNLQKEIAVGKFRLGGEVHQWMYDRYSLSKLLIETGFSQVEIRDAFTSSILNWNSYELESKNGIVYKPDSLFVEAIK